MGILCLAAALQKNNYGVKIYQPRCKLLIEKDYDYAVADILKSKPAYIGFSTWCISYPGVILIANKIKKLSPTTPIIFGGPQASILPEKTLELFPFVDYILSGEADNTLPQFLNELKKKSPDLSKISGLCYRTESGKICQNKIVTQISDLNLLPIPDYKFGPKQKTFMLDVGRGCPFKCTYCTTNIFFSKKYRTKSTDRIVKEMMILYKKQNIRSIGFSHDMFTLNRKFVFELCEKLISLKAEKGIEFKWNCSARIDCVSEKMLLKMKEAGCDSVFFGIETGSSDIQKIIRKNLKINTFHELAEFCRKINLRIHASYILGFPEENKSDINATLKHVTNMLLKGVLVQNSILSLLPGTPLFTQHKNKLKYDGKFSNFSGTVCSEEELKLIIKYPEIFSSFYYVPVNTMNRKEMFFLSLLINKSTQFINTFFLLRHEIHNDIIGKDLLQLFKNELQKISSVDESTPFIMHLIRILNNLIFKVKFKLPPFILDVFNYEVYSSLLMDLYLKWQFLHSEINNIDYSGDFLIKPVPVWKMLSTFYLLEKTVPSENNWENNNNEYRKGNYNYLLVATSEVDCKRIKINTKEIFLLENLSELYFSEYVKRVKSILSREESLLWIKKLKRWGMVTLRQ